MKGKLLICIAFHYSPERLKYLYSVVTNILSNYYQDLKIIIDTNTAQLLGLPDDHRIKIAVHSYLEHPFHLTWAHRKHTKDNIDNYETFAYFEDDMLLPFENYTAYLEKFKMLWPQYVPSFIRVEKKDGEDYVSDVPVKPKEQAAIVIEGRKFISFKFPHNYYAFWVMPQKQLKETMKDDFVRMNDGREFAAMYVGWELQKTPLVEVYEKDGKYFVDESCYSYHLPNNFALSPDSPNGKILVKEIFA